MGQAVPIVKYKVHSLQVTSETSRMVGWGPGLYSVLRMPHYATSLAKMVQLKHSAILQGGRRMQAALEHVHVRGYVHMDVKV